MVPPSRYRDQDVRLKSGRSATSFNSGPAFRRFFAYKEANPARQCRVSFTDASGITHSVDVTAETLYEAVALALRDLRASGLVPVLPGPVTPISVRVMASVEAEHSIRFSQFQSWLGGRARSPKERLTKDRLRSMVGGE